jgi:hypothetical protein
MSLYLNWAYADNMGILRAFVSAPVGHTRTGAVSQKLIKPVTEKPATSRLFNFPQNNPGQTRRCRRMHKNWQSMD